MLTNWIIAAKLLSRYKLSYSPFSKLGHGSFIEYENGRLVVQVSPFDPVFMEIFLHEVGHAVYKKNCMRYKIWRSARFRIAHYDMIYREKDFSSVLEEEVFASKFAYKASKKLKIQCNKAKLLQWFYTYTGVGYKYLTNTGVDRSAYTNHVSKLINKLEKA